MDIETFLYIVGIVIIATISVYAVVNRICKCFENCKIAKAYESYINDCKKGK